MEQIGKNGKSKKLLVRSAVSAVILVTMIFALLFSSACAAALNRYTAKDFSEEEHKQRVTERVEKMYIESGKYENFEVHPLYNYKDELEFFLVDFEPTGFVYVKINANGGASGLGCCSYGMYTQDYLCKYFNEPWYRYVIDENAEPTTIIEYGHMKTVYKNRRFETDADGNLIPYTDSHFKVANIADERWYFLQIRQHNGPEFIPAVKRGDKFLNLVSMEEFVYDTQEKDFEYPAANNTFIPEGEYNL